MFRQSEKILTWELKGKMGYYIAKQEYEVLRDFILAVLKSHDATLTELIDLAKINLARSIESDLSWQVLVVKRDLEARGLIGTVTKWVPNREQFLRLKTREVKRTGNISHGRRA